MLLLKFRVYNPLLLVKSSTVSRSICCLGQGCRFSCYSPNRVRLLQPDPSLPPVSQQASTQHKARRNRTWVQPPVCQPVGPKSENVTAASDTVPEAQKHPRSERDVLATSPCDSCRGKDDSESLLRSQCKKTWTVWY